MNNKRSMILILASMIFGILMMMLGGCSGGGDGTVTDERAAQLSGVFIDSPVEGLYYETDSKAGHTDANGTFSYMAGETIAFFIGDVMIGQAPAQGFMTPVNLVEGAVNETHPAVTNMAMLIQTLDVDGNPDNGITITPEVEDAMMGRQVDFHLDTFEFQRHPEIVELMAQLNEMGAFSNGPHDMVSATDAQDHMRQHIGSSNAGDNSDNLGMGRKGDAPPIHDDERRQRLPGMTPDDGMGVSL